MTRHLVAAALACALGACGGAGDEAPQGPACDACKPDDAVCNAHDGMESVSVPRIEHTAHGCRYGAPGLGTFSLDCTHPPDPRYCDGRYCAGTLTCY